MSALAEGTLDLETRTTALLSGNEMDFTRLVALGDAEKDPRKQLVLYEKASELYDNPMVQERIDAAGQRVSKKSKSDRFWRISGYASPAFLVGFGLAFYGFISDAFNARALVEKTSQIPVYQAEIERQAAEINKAEQEASELQTRLDASDSAHTEKLTACYNSAQEQAHQLQARLDTSNSACEEKLKGSYDSAQEQARQLQARLDASNSAYEEKLKGCYDSAQEQARQLQARLDASDSAHKKELNTCYALSDSKAQRVRQEYDRRVRKIEDKINQLKRSIPQPAPPP